MIIKYLLLTIFCNRMSGVSISVWLKMQKIKKLNNKISKTPLKFRKNFSPQKNRIINRK